jgi:hypothetical protein
MHMVPFMEIFVIYFHNYLFSNVILTLHIRFHVWL